MTAPDAVARQECPPCPRCGGQEVRLICEGHDYLHGLPGVFGAVECTGCGLAFESPRPATDVLSSYYPSEYAPHEAIDAAGGPSFAFRTYLHARWGYPKPEPTAVHRRDWRSLPLVRSWFATAELIPRFVPDGRVLEIGCGSGNRLQTLQQLGWNRLDGIEMVPAAAAAAASRGFDVLCGPAEELLGRHPDASFDVVIASMVLEHLYDPFAVLALMIQKLKPGGELLLSTVVRDSLDARIYGRYWGGYDFPRHLVYFTKQDVVRALRTEIEDIHVAHQPAPQDFERSSTWRGAEGRLFDKLILVVSRNRSLALMSCMGLAWARQTCRIAIRGRKLGR